MSHIHNHFQNQKFDMRPSHFLSDALFSFHYRFSVQYTHSKILVPQSTFDASKNRRTGALIFFSLSQSGCAVTKHIIYSSLRGGTICEIGLIGFVSLGQEHQSNVIERCEILSVKLHHDFAITLLREAVWPSNKVFFFHSHANYAK